MGISGTPVAISADPATNEEQAAVVFNTANQEYLVVWRDFGWPVRHPRPERVFCTRFYARPNAAAGAT